MFKHEHFCTMLFDFSGLGPFFFLRFFSDFWRFWEGFAKHFGRFFSNIFCTQIEKRDFVKISVSLRREHEKQGFEV